MKIVNYTDEFTAFCICNLINNPVNYINRLVPGVQVRILTMYEYLDDSF